MVRFLLLQHFHSQARRSVATSLAAACVLAGLISLVAGCGGEVEQKSPAVADAEAALAREKSIRDGLVHDLKKLAGEHQVHVARAAIIAGEWKPPLPTGKSKSPLVRSLPSWGIRRVWRLWGRHPQEMPWYDSGLGSMMARSAKLKFEYDTRTVEVRIEAQNKRVDEAKKYLDLVKKIGRDS
jgi:hypothetical protein